MLARGIPHNCSYADWLRRERRFFESVLAARFPLNCKVLALDLDDDLRAALASALRRAGYQVEEGDDGPAIASAAEAPAALVVKVPMPERDGLEAIQAARARWPGVRVIATTAGRPSMPAEYLLGLAAHLGTDATLPKNAPAEAFRATLDGLLRRPC